MMKNFLKSLGEMVVEYETPKIVTIRNVRIGILYRLLQLVIIIYIVGYTIFYTKGYQEKEIGQATVLTKVKGTSSSYYRLDLGSDYRRIWDAADYIVPPMMPNSLFIITNVVITAQQRMGNCPEDPKVSKSIICDPLNNTCQTGKVIQRGELTGKCVESGYPYANYTCEIFSWCPLEDDTIADKMKEPVINGVENFTVFFKNYVEFPRFNAKRRNLDSINGSYAKYCLYNPKTDSLCPIFQIGHIVKLIKGNFSHISLTGGVINVLIRWGCDLDWDIKYCTPEIRFSSMDDTSANSFSPGYNFRFANHYRTSDGQLYRDLVKAYGILFIFNVEAEARKFDVVQLTLNVGAGLALLGLVSIFIDIILFNVGKERRYYQEKKYITVSQDELKQYKMSVVSAPSSNRKT